MLSLQMQNCVDQIVRIQGVTFSIWDTATDKKIVWLVFGLRNEAYINVIVLYQK